jgi:hypothetical protein
MKYILLILVIFSLTAVDMHDTSAHAIDNAKSLKTLCYEPCKVRLTGEVLLISVKNHPEYDYYILRIKTPINVKGNPVSETDTDSYTNVKRIQISSNPDKWPIHPYIGKVVTIEGSLFEANTAHHRTKVLIWVDKITMSIPTRS